MAGAKYESIRSDLVKFFECRGCLSPSELADDVINRVARRIMEGETILPGALTGYFYGVARNVMREHLRSPEREISPLELLPPAGQPYELPNELTERRRERIRREQHLECLESCIKELPPETERLIISYYEGGDGEQIEKRKQMAKELGIPINNLRIRVHRVREKLERCLIDCMKNMSDE